MRLFTLFLGTALALSATIVYPTSYDMPNGTSLAYQYWDESYNGLGDTTTNDAPLTGGLGDLTDGLIAGGHWNVVEAPPGPGPYVAWVIDPIITFHFPTSYDFILVRIHFDDDGGGGGVTAPGSVTINGVNYLVTDPAGPSPFWAEFGVSAPPTDTLTIQLFRAGGTGFIFASEFEFNAVPEPSTMGLGGAALFGIGLLARRRRCN